MKPKIAIIIIHYNTPQYLRPCLDHIFAQTYKNIDVYFIDNNSPDKTGLKAVKRIYASRIDAPDEIKLTVIPNKENLGYARAANQGIHLATDADYIVITNPDIIYSPTYFEKIVARAEKSINKEHTRFAGITGKILKYDFVNNCATGTIDSAGLKIHRSLRVTDEGQGHKDSEKFDKEKEVFGISGACPLYYRPALEDAAITINGNKEYFDEDFFMYKEDVDISWRLQLIGYHFLYYPKAIAFHGRGTGVIKRDTIGQILKNRKTLSKFQRYYSFRNQNLMILKNLLWRNYIRNFFYILSNDLIKFLYALFCEPFVLKSFPEYVKLFGKMLKKRKQIMAKVKANSGASASVGVRNPAKTIDAFMK